MSVGGLDTVRRDVAGISIAGSGFLCPVGNCAAKSAEGRGERAIPYLSRRKVPIRRTRMANG